MTALDDPRLVPSTPDVDNTERADMRIEIVKRELNQGALAGLGRTITTYAAHLVVAALDNFDEDAVTRAFAKGFTTGATYQRRCAGLPDVEADLYREWLDETRNAALGDSPKR